MLYSVGKKSKNILCQPNRMVTLKKCVFLSIYLLRCHNPPANTSAKITHQNLVSNFCIFQGIGISSAGDNDYCELTFKALNYCSDQESSPLILHSYHLK